MSSSFALLISKYYYSCIVNIRIPYCQNILYNLLINQNIKVNNNFLEIMNCLYKLFEKNNIECGLLNFLKKRKSKKIKIVKEERNDYLNVYLKDGRSFFDEHNQEQIEKNKKNKKNKKNVKLMTLNENINSKTNDNNNKKKTNNNKKDKKMFSKQKKENEKKTKVFNYWDVKFPDSGKNENYQDNDWITEKIIYKEKKNKKQKKEKKEKKEKKNEETHDFNWGEKIIVSDLIVKKRESKIDFNLVDKISDEERKQNYEEKMKKEKIKKYGIKQYKYNEIIENGSIEELLYHMNEYDYEKNIPSISLCKPINDEFEKWKKNVFFFTSNIQLNYLMDIIRIYDPLFHEYILERSYNNRLLLPIDRNKKIPIMTSPFVLNVSFGYSARKGSNVVFNKNETMEMNDDNCLTYLYNIFNKSKKGNYDNKIFKDIYSYSRNHKTKYNQLIRKIIHYMIIEEAYHNGLYLNDYTITAQNIINKFIKTYGIKLNCLYTDQEFEKKLIT
jgi:hypothetical protein